MIISSDLSYFKEIRDKYELIHFKLQQEPETPITQLLRDKGMNQHTWYKWKRRYLDKNLKIVDDKGIDAK